MAAKLPTVVIVGRPNVGKSTIFNRLAGKRIAVVEDTPGVTRDRLYTETDWNGKRFRIVDTGGIMYSQDDPLIDQIRLQAQIAIEEADVVLFVADVSAGVNPDDIELANRMRSLKKPIFIVVNKADNPQRDAYAQEFYSLGLGDVWPISGLHGRGVADLLDEVVDLLPTLSEQAEVKEESRLAIIGRPNVGKSSLLNAFAGETRSIVSDIPGTTRDAIDTELTWNDEAFRLVDTAGIRRRGKIQGTVEYYMVNRATKALERADCGVVVVNGEEGLTDGDKRIAKLSLTMGKACVFAVNKWDLVEEPGDVKKPKTQPKQEFTRQLRDETPELFYAPIVFTSAKEGIGLEAVLRTASMALQNHAFRISTGHLNRLIQDATYEKPLTRKGRPVRIYYATQVSTKPPTIVLFANDADLVHFSYLRYLENQIRKNFPLEGTPLNILVRSSHERKER